MDGCHVTKAEALFKRFVAAATHQVAPPHLRDEFGSGLPIGAEGGAVADAAADNHVGGHGALLKVGRDTSPVAGFQLI